MGALLVPRMIHELSTYTEVAIPSPCIVDSLGDNVGDMSGMGADLCDMFAEASARRQFMLRPQVRWRIWVPWLSFSEPPAIYRVYDEHGAVEKH